MEIDHIFICTEYGAPEAEILKKFGLREGSSNRHLGQGTRNRRFFFRNFFIELLWVENLEEVKNKITAPTRLYERLRPKNKDVSPFGICFRPEIPMESSPKFTSWHYKPAYLPSDLFIEIAKNTMLSEPMWFFIAFGSRPDSNSYTNREPLRHMKKVSEVTAIQVTVPNLEKNFTLFEHQEISRLKVVDGEEHLMEIIFDNAKQGCAYDFRPTLPLIFIY